MKILFSNHVYLVLYALQINPFSSKIFWTPSIQFIFGLLWLILKIHDPIWLTFITVASFSQPHKFQTNTVGFL